MVSLMELKEDEDVPALQVEYGGRRFPLNWDRPTERPKNRVKRLVERTQKQPLEDLVGESIWKRLAWFSITPEAPERQPIVEAYVRSLNQMDGFRREVEELVRHACLANLEFRQARGETNVNARDAVMDAKLQELLTEAAHDWLPTKNVLDAKLVSEPIPKIHEKLDTALTQAVAEFTKQFFELLAKLVDRQLFGLVEWLPNHCCSYHFFKHVVIQENIGASQREVSETLFNQITERDSATGRQIIGTRQIEVTRGQGQHQHRFARHQHEVMSAVRTSVRNSQVVMPPAVVRLVEVVPEWLYDFVQVIDGDIFRERIVEQDSKVEDWADVQVRDEPIIGCEPGVIIGPYVLTGWGPREVAAESDRRKSVAADAAREHSVNAARRRAPLFAAATLTLTLAALGLLLHAMRGNEGMMMAIVATVTAIGTLWQAAFDDGTARRNPTAALSSHFLTVSLGCHLLVAEWFIARWYMPLSWLTPVALLGVALVSQSIGRRFR